MFSLVFIGKFPKPKSAYGTLMELSVYRTKTGAKKMAVTRCADCGVLFWGKRMMKEMGFALYCRDCYCVRFDRELPEYVRSLNPYEHSLIQAHYAETGCKISFVPIDAQLAAA